jgi:hypothetical protein
MAFDVLIGLRFPVRWPRGYVGPDLGLPARAGCLGGATQPAGAMDISLDWLCSMERPRTANYQLSISTMPLTADKPPSKLPRRQLPVVLAKWLVLGTISRKTSDSTRATATGKFNIQRPKPVIYCHCECECTRASTRSGFRKLTVGAPR